MKDILRYKDFFATVHFSSEDDVFFGKIEGVSDLITFEGASVNELKESFYEAVDDYLLICEQNSKEPFKSYKGSFNIRVTPALHKKASETALSEGITLNQFIQKAIENELLHHQK